MKQGRRQTIQVTEVSKPQFTLNDLHVENPHIKMSSLTAYLRRETIKGNYVKVGVVRRNVKGKPPIIYSRNKN